MNQNVTDVTPKKERWRNVFLAALRQSPNVSAAASASGKNRMFVYRARKKSPTFAQEWDDALQESMDVAEGEAYRRGVEGWEEPVFGSLGGNAGSGEIGRIRKHSDTLLIFLLKAHKPEKYKERLQIDVSALDNAIAAELARVAGRGEVEDAGTAEGHAESGTTGNTSPV